MKSIVYEEPKLVSFQTQEMPLISEGEVLIKTSHVGICGSDLNIFAGVHPRAQPPLIMGHEFSGTIVEGHPFYSEGTKVSINPLLTCGHCYPCKTGQSHVCKNLKLIGIDYNGGMGEYAVAPIENVVKLPEDMSMAGGALIEPVAVAVHAVRQGRYVLGDSAIIFGAGTIGLCVALTLRSYGATNVTIIDPNELRLKKAEELGFSVVHPSLHNVKELIQEKTNEMGTDIVFDCAGHPSVLDHLTSIVRIQGNIVIVAAYKKPAEINLLQGMFKELSIQFVRVYTKKDFDIASRLLASNSNFEEIITHSLRPEDAKKGFDLLTTKTDAIKVMYNFD